MLRVSKAKYPSCFHNGEAERAISGEQSEEEFAVKVASRPEEIKVLLDVGFEYVCAKGEMLFFKKRW